MSASNEDQAAVQNAAAYVRDHPGRIQSNTIEHIMGGRSYGWARDRVKRAVQAGLIIERRRGNRLFLYPPENA